MPVKLFIQSSRLALLLMRITAIAFGFIIQMMLARMLTVAEFGATQLILTTVVIAGLLLQAGTGKSLVKMIVEINSQPQKQAIAGSFIIGWLVFSLFTITFVSLTGLGFDLQFLQNIQAHNTSLLLIILWILSYSFIIVGTSILRAHFKLKSAIFLLDLFFPLVLLLILGVLYWQHSTLTVHNVVLYYSITAASAAVICMLALGYYKLIKRPVADKKFYKTIAIASLPILLLELSHLAFNQGAVWTVGVFGSLETVAMFAVAYKLTDLIVMPSRLMTNLVEPTLVALHKENNAVKFQQYLNQSAWFITLPAILIAAFFLVAGKPLIALTFGAEYQNTYPYLCLFALVRLTGPALNGFGQSTLIMTGHAVRIMQFEVFISSVTVVSMLLAGYFISTEALIYALAGGFLVRNFTLLILCKHLTGHRCYVYKPSIT